MNPERQTRLLITPIYTKKKGGRARRGNGVPTGHPVTMKNTAPSRALRDQGFTGAAPPTPQK